MKHRHQAVPAKSQDLAWTHCVTPALCAALGMRELAHGNITRHDQCACGATRQTEINGGRYNYGEWQEAAR